MDNLCDKLSQAAVRSDSRTKSRTRCRVTGQKPRVFSIIVFATYCSLLTAVQSQMIVDPSAALPSAWSSGRRHDRFWIADSGFPAHPFLPSASVMPIVEQNAGSKQCVDLVGKY
jgi:hypothetical protein